MTDPTRCPTHVAQRTVFHGSRIANPALRI
jgi:hypothetical protein